MWKTWAIEKVEWPSLLSAPECRIKGHGVQEGWVAGVERSETPG